MKPSISLQSRREFLQRSGLLAGFIFPLHLNLKKMRNMKKEEFDVIIIGGSYSGLSAAMALGRALRKVLVIDGGKPANRFTPRSHNFITHDGRTPGEIATIAKQQVEMYTSVTFKNGYAIDAQQYRPDFLVTVASGEAYISKKIILATGIVDLMPDIPGFAECWGKSVLHCPYCHGYEVRNVETGILGNGDYAFEFGTLISNWTKNLKVYADGRSTLTDEQRLKLAQHNIEIVEERIRDFSHTEGLIHQINLENGISHRLSALYARPAFIQHSEVSALLGCELTMEGYIKVDQSQRTSIPGIFACGDNVTKIRTVANAVSLGTTAGMMVNKELVQEYF